MHITAKVDYAVRTLVELAAVGPDPAKAEFLAKSQVIPHKFLEAVLSDLRRGGLVNSRRGRTGDTGSLGPRTRSRLPTSYELSKDRWLRFGVSDRKTSTTGDRQRPSRRCGLQCESTSVLCSKMSHSPMLQVASCPSSFTN